MTYQELEAKSLATMSNNEAKSQYLFEKFISDNEIYIDWHALLINRKLTESFARRYSKELDLKNYGYFVIATKGNCSEEFITEFVNMFSQIDISRFSTRNYSLMSCLWYIVGDNHNYDFNHLCNALIGITSLIISNDIILCTNKLKGLYTPDIQSVISRTLFSPGDCANTDKYMRPIAEVLFWHVIIAYNKVSESFINLHASNIDWKLATRKQTMSESFMTEYAEKLDWDWISENVGKFTKQFIDKFKHKLNWDVIIKAKNMVHGTFYSEVPMIADHEVKVQPPIIADVSPEETNGNTCDKIDKQKQSRNIRARETIVSCVANGDNVPSKLFHLLTDDEWEHVSENQMLPDWAVIKYCDKINMHIAIIRDCVSPDLIDEIFSNKDIQSIIKSFK